MYYKIKYYSKVLERIKKEHEKRNILYDHGVDLINYQNEYTTLLLESIVFELPFLSDEDLGWWLYEDVTKVYYMKDETVVSVRTAFEFLTNLYKWSADE